MKRILTLASIALVAIGAAACTREKPPVTEPTPTGVVAQAITPQLSTTVPGGVASLTIPVVLPTPVVTGTFTLPPGTIPTVLPSAATPTLSGAVKPGATSATSVPSSSSTSTLGMATAAPPPAGTGTATTYKVEWGDWLNKIAAKFGVTTEAILAANPGLVANRIYPGQVINIPAGGVSVPTAVPGATETPDQTNPPPAPNPGTYTVQRGDWFYTIPRKFGVSVPALQAANPNINPNFVYPGQVLNIPGGTTSGSESPSNPSGGNSYTVRAGDTLYMIAVRFGKTVYELQIANHLPNPNAIYPGQTLIIP